MCCCRGHGWLPPSPRSRPGSATSRASASFPDRCDDALVALARRRAELLERGRASADALATLDALTAAFERSAAAARSLERRLLGLAELRREPRSSDGVRFPVRAGRGSCSRSATASPRAPRSELLRPARLRGAARELRRHRQGRRAGQALVPARACADAGRPRLGADLVVGLDVRVPDAGARHAGAGRTACSSRPAGSSSADRSTTAPSWACRGASPNRAFNARDIELTYQYSNFGVPGLGLQARPRRRRRHRALRDRAGGDGRSARPRSRNFARLAEAGARGRYGFYEALDYTPSRAARRRSGRRSCAPTWRTIRG